MATLGSNLKIGCHLRLKAVTMKILGMAARRGGFKMSKSKIYFKMGVPASNTANDSPGGANTWIVDKTNSAVYFCNAWTNSGSFTLVKVSP